ncbi:32 kDa beta-galactoside-binding lectin lec-3-like [Culex pipiens pallens]|uniref:32 kDa beta-galactoside-binding lectin lec-3-like n=1 Tax=Culex pipiens pallens TaxID=42434 RepID=UPI0019547532|nr:32 kDa beta-galactoside-binding lectin lec-3-like [Culex pipiens pallens]
MTSNQVLAPTLPFMGQLPGPMVPGCRIRLKAKINRPNGDLRLHLQSGASLNPMDDVPLHLTFLPATREVIRNSYAAARWGQEVRTPNSPINFEEDFDLAISAHPQGFNLEINSEPPTSFNNQSPQDRITHIFLTGGAVVQSITYDNWIVTPTIPKEIMPSAPAFAPSPVPVPFQIPAWPHTGHVQFFGPPPPMLYSPQQPAFNPAMMMGPQQPLLVNIPGLAQKNNDNGTTMQYQIMVTVLWKLVCVLFKILKYIAVAVICGFGVYIISKRLRL